MKVAAFGQLVLALTLLASRPSRASEGVQVALVLSPGETALAERLHAELALLGFGVVKVDGDGPDSPLDLVARRANAIAAIRIISSAGGVEVWIADRLTGKTLLRQVVSGREGAPLAPADVALQAVELLRASLLELGSPLPSRGEVKPSPRIQAIAEDLNEDRGSTTHAVALDVGGGMLTSPGGIPASLHLQLELGWRGAWPLGVRILASVPLKSSHIGAAEGTASIATTLVGAGLDLHWGGTGSRWRSVAGLGMSVLWLDMQGIGASSLLGVTGNAVTLAPYLRLDLSLRLAKRLHILAEGLAGYALAQPTLRFVGREVAVFGRPCVATTLAIRVGWL